jgi:hypothetical protein
MNSGYHGLEALWHDLFWEAEEAPSEIHLIDDFLRDHDGTSLYVGSGSGRLLGPLVAAGHRLTGLEISPEMVALSRESFPDVSVIESSWQEHEADEKYSSILIPAFTFQLFPDPQKQLQRLRAQTDHLYLTLFFPWAEVTGDLPQNEWYFDRGIRLPTGEMGELETRHKIKESSGSLTRKHRYTLKDKSGSVVREEITEQALRFFPDASLKKLLKNTGWEIEKEIYNLGESEEDDLVYVATMHLRGSA